MVEARRRTLHGRRRGKKLRAGQQSLLDTLLPRLALALPLEPAKIDLAQAFGGSLPPDGVWLEIGFGAGEHLVWQAGPGSGVGLIGCATLSQRRRLLPRPYQARALPVSAVHRDAR
jgi:tRNA (guanine-N7-)-methyltransferase